MRDRMGRRLAQRLVDAFPIGLGFWGPSNDFMWCWGYMQRLPRGLELGSGGGHGGWWSRSILFGAWMRTRFRGGGSALDGSVASR